MAENWGFMERSARSDEREALAAWSHIDGSELIADFGSGHELGLDGRKIATVAIVSVCRTDAHCLLATANAGHAHL